MSARLAAIAQFIGLVAGLFGLTVQFSISVPATVNMGWSVGGAIVWFFSYFTILSNILVAATLTAAALAPDSRGGRFLLRPPVAMALERMTNSVTSSTPLLATGVRITP